MRFNFSSAIWASILATIIMTIVMYFLDMNIMVALGMAAGMEGTTILVVGGLIHLCVGIVYGLIYALIFEPILKRLPGFLAGAFYSLLAFFIALFFMGPFLQSIGKFFGAEKKIHAMCAPCMPAAKPKSTMSPSPCHPCMSKATPKPLHNPCNPCGGRGGMAILWSLVSHLVYGIVLGWAYRPRIKKA
ncbi:MAG: hypothetical protein K1000chlam3_00449 [Chlamydiae bacterium]|nr:hypothetical protein [Chlamydiota bacterium]